MLQGRGTPWSFYRHKTAIGVGRMYKYQEMGPRVRDMKADQVNYQKMQLTLPQVTICCQTQRPALTCFVVNFPMPDELLMNCGSVS